MANSTALFEKFSTSLANGLFDLPSDTIKVILLPSSASPNIASWQYYSDVVGEFSTGGGYTAGGATLASQSLTLVAANSWTQTWATGAWSVGQIIRPNTANGYLYTCVVAGTSSGTEPTWGTTVGETTADPGGVVWLCIGAWAETFTSAALTWTSLTLSSIGFAIGYKSTGTASTSPLIFCETINPAQSPSSQNFVVSPLSPEGWFQFTPG